MAVNEEELSVIVQKYSVLFDKSHKEFHRKDVKKNAWDAVAGDMKAPEVFRSILETLIHVLSFSFLIMFLLRRRLFKIRRATVKSRRLLIDCHVENVL